MEILELPDELLVAILRFLEVKTVLKVRILNRRFRKVSDVDALWKFFCFRDYGIGESQLWDGWLYREFFSVVLHKFYYLVGWWKRCTRFYGGLLKITIEKDGLNCYECLPPLDDCFLQCSQLKPYLTAPLTTVHPSLTILPTSDYSPSGRHNLRLWRLFSIKAIGKGLRVACFQEDLGLRDKMYHKTCPLRHECGTRCDEIDFVAKRTDGFRFLCQNMEAHRRVDLAYFFEMEHGFRAETHEMLQEIASALEIHEEGQYYACRITKFRFLATDGTCFQAQRLDEIQHYPNTIAVSGQSLSPESILPSLGLYCGTYSVHGWEILNFGYDNNAINCTKITGDPNVPSGQLSVIIRLDKPLCLDLPDLDDWNSIADALELAQETNFAINDIDAFKCQRFAVPHNTYVRINEQLPKFCRSRFLADGQIASHGFQGPEFVPCIASIIDYNCVAVLWVQLHTLSFYYRAVEQPAK